MERLILFYTALIFWLIVLVVSVWLWVPSGILISLIVICLLLVLLVLSNPK